MLAQHRQKLCQIKFGNLQVLRQRCDVDHQRIVIKKTRTFGQLLTQRCRNSVNAVCFEQQSNQWQISAFDVVTLGKRSV